MRLTFKLELFPTVLASIRSPTLASQHAVVFPMSEEAGVVSLMDTERENDREA